MSRGQKSQNKEAGGMHVRWQTQQDHSTKKAALAFTQLQ